MHQNRSGYPIIQFDLLYTHSQSFSFWIVPCQDIASLLLQHINLLFKPDVFLSPFLVSQHLTFTASRMATSISPNFSETLIINFLLHKELLNLIQGSSSKKCASILHTNQHAHIMTNTNHLRLDSMMTAVLSKTSVAFLPKTSQAL